MTGPIVRVRPARAADHAAIVAFNAALALETESKALDRSVLESGVAQALADPDRLRYWVAEADSTVIGQAAITSEWSDWRDGWIWWFQSVYVRPDHRRQGVFRALFEAIREAARSAGDVVGLRLYVEAHNHRAHRTYQAMGLEPGGYHVYEVFWASAEGGAGPNSSMRYPPG